MLDTIFATKIDMTQAWTKTGQRIAITRCRVNDNMVVEKRQIKASKPGVEKWMQHDCYLLNIAYHNGKKFEKMTKPLREKLKKSGFSKGVNLFEGIKVFVNEKKGNDNPDFDQIEVGSLVDFTKIFKVGDMVKVRGKSKGRGFAGVMKRHGFHGGPRTHGQTDRERAPGSIGSQTDPGRVWKNKKMPGHYGQEYKTVKGITIVHVDADNKEIWISGPVPGHKFSVLRITKTNQSKKIELNMVASGIKKSTDKSPKTDQIASQAENKAAKVKQKPGKDSKSDQAANSNNDTQDKQEKKQDKKIKAGKKKADKSKKKNTKNEKKQTKK